MPGTRIVLRTAVACAFALLAACGGRSLSGTYVDMRGNVHLDFRSGGKVQYSAGETGFTEMDDYTISGNKVTVKSARGTVGILQIRSDGCLDSPTMGVMCKPDSSS